MGRICSRHEGQEKYVRGSAEKNLKERGHMADLGKEGRVLKKQNGMMWNEFIFL